MLWAMGYLLMITEVPHRLRIFACHYVPFSEVCEIQFLYRKFFQQYLAVLSTNLLL
jgi:hypothetical protein